MTTDWSRVQELAESGRSPNALGLLELRARVEALDTYKELIDKLFRRVWELEDSRNKIRSGPESPLIERVADAIAAQATSAGIVNDRPARAAILEVSKWLAAQSNSVTGQAWAAQLEIEAGG